MSNHPLSSAVLVTLSAFLFAGTGSAAIVNVLDFNGTTGQLQQITIPQSGEYVVTFQFPNHTIVNTGATVLTDSTFPSDVITLTNDANNKGVITFASDTPENQLLVPPGALLLDELTFPTVGVSVTLRDAAGVNTTLTIANFFSDPSEVNPSDIISYRTGAGGIPVNILTPEPGTFLITGCAVLLGLRRRRKPTP